MTIMKRLRVVGYAALLLLATLPACTSDGHIEFLGYSSRPNHDTSIRTVRVPIFKNETYRRGLEFALTKAVIREIESRTPWKVVPAGYDADTELVGTILGRTKGLVTLNQVGEVRDAETTLTLEVVWHDLRGPQPGDILADPRSDAVLPPPPQPVPPPPKVIVQSMWNFRPELGESLATAEQRMVERMARQIVNMMEAPW